MTDDLHALLSVLDGPVRPEGDFADALLAELCDAIGAEKLSIAFEVRREPRATSWDFPAIVEPVASRATRPRRLRRLAIAAAAVLAIVAIAGIVSLSGRDPGRIQTPLRPVPNTTPDVSTTHAIVVTPSTGLRDRQIVRVTGQFAPAHGDSIRVSTCRVGVTLATAGTECDATTVQNSPLKPIATTALRRYPYMVRRMITLFGGRPVDCAAAPGCVLFAASPDRLKGAIHLRHQDVYGAAPLAFDPVAPPMPGPAVTVTPSAGLRDGDAVTVRGQHFRPLASTSVTVCVSGSDVCDDVGGTGVPAGPDGSVSLTHRPWSVFSLADGTLQDCHRVSCVLRVTSNYDARVQPQSESVGDAPVSFAPAAPAAFPQLTLDPAGPYTDGQQVTVTVLGWPGSIGRRPGLEIHRLALGLCTRPPFIFGSTSTACAEKTALLGPDAAGRYTATLTVHRSLGSGVSNFDCTEPGNCRVTLVLELGSDGAPPYYEVILGTDLPLVASAPAP